MQSRSAAVLEARGPVAFLSPLRAESIARAAAGGAAPVLVTGEGTRLTEPMRQVLTEASGRWVVEGAAGPRDGLTGERFDGAGPDPVHAASWTPDEEQLLLTGTIRHRADRVMLGEGLAMLLDALRLPGPAGWGPHEPVERRWEPRAMSAFAGSLRSPSVRLVVAGAHPQPLIGSLRAVVHGRSVWETMQVVAGAGSPGSADAERVRGAVPGALVQLADRLLPLFAIVWRRDGRRDLTTVAVRQRAPLPVAMLIGAPGVRDLGVAVDDLRQRTGATVAGRARLPALVVPLDGSMARLEAAVDAIGRDRIRRVAGPRGADRPS